jgi:4-amino-4-deoxy-L-arabinose transferase-like glycosyltransferase
MKAAPPFVLAALVLFQAGIFIANSSGTFDETVYLHQAEDIFQRRDNADLAAKGVAPLPVLLLYSLPAAYVVPDYAQAILLARMCAVAAVAVPLVLVVYFWLAGELGAPAAAIGAALVALSPTVIANASIAATDAAFVLFALLMLWALARYIDEPGWLRLAALVIAAAIAFAAKYSAIALFGAAAVALAWMDRPDRRWWARLATAAAIPAAMFVAGLAVTWNYHPIAGLLSQLHHQRLGHEAYLFGRLSTLGWWYYQPAALAVKSTYVELAAMVLSAVAFAAALRSMPSSVRVWGIASGVMLVLAMTSRVNIGVRYVLLLYPLAIMSAAAWTVRIARRRWIAVAIGVAALSAQAAANVAIAPRYLSYFNGLAGGPMNGYRALADSNLDWGQDLPAIRQVLASVGAREPLAAYFGSAPPDAYGVHVWPWDIAGPAVKRRADWIVISATYLVGLYVPNDRFEPFRRIEPTARPTPTLFVYDASRPEVQSALAAVMASQP